MDICYAQVPLDSFYKSELSRLSEWNVLEGNFIIEASRLEKKVQILSEEE
jgi:hypothetical protein